ncbi:hypothetical protein GNI_079010 [Gregarina niphandrodes]|uniref:Uncharacterized protein n=1 Tax=Gregarina niphandrodes TaxID=110365 RepID=A0A023B6K2_GRENI|nr:hypothetical protein GNI_079010 [Gregarina niphandrodes]EZG66582.1 hypothetical protein GNI_079010 [Gregarina niphandrodes]|eukprot:XP_011130591.1 hypothetical protein GNI_079010 [Gregarina niphandrodes]
MFPIQNRRSSDQVFLLTGDSPTIEQLVANAREASWEEPVSAATTEKEITDYRLHIVDLPATRDGENSPPDVLGKLVAGIEYLRTLAPMVCDLRSLRRLIQNETRTKWRPKRKETKHGGDLKQGGDIKQGGDLKQGGETKTAELKLSTINLPVLEQLVRLGPVTTSRLLCEWPTLVVSVATGQNDLGGIDEEGPGVLSKVLPLDAVHDVLFLAKRFRTELDDLLRDNHHENHHDFSMFSALYVWQLISQHTEWAPFYLKENNDENDDDAVTIGKGKDTPIVRIHSGGHHSGGHHSRGQHTRDHEQP